MNILDQTKQDMLRFVKIARDCGKYNERLLSIFKHEATTITFDMRERLENNIQRSTNGSKYFNLQTGSR